jgi:hypothetical protein
MKVSGKQTSKDIHKAASALLVCSPLVSLTAARFVLEEQTRQIDHSRGSSSRYCCQVLLFIKSVTSFCNSHALENIRNQFCMGWISYDLGRACLASTHNRNATTASDERLVSCQSKLLNVVAYV